MAWGEPPLMMTSEQAAEGETYCRSPDGQQMEQAPGICHASPTSQ